MLNVITKIKSNHKHEELEIRTLCPLKLKILKKLKNAVKQSQSKKWSAVDECKDKSVV